MRQPIDLRDGWWRVPGDDGKLGSPRALPFSGYFWALMIDGFPFAVCQMSSDADMANAAPNGAMTRLLAVMDRDGDASVYDLLRKRTHSYDAQCKWNGRPVHQKIENVGIRDDHTFDVMSFKIESQFIAEAVEKMKPALRRGLQAWPYCGRGGTVELGGKIHRATKTISGVWRCSCFE